MTKDLVKQYIAGTLPAQEATKIRERVKAYEKRRELSRLNDVLRRGFPRLRQELAYKMVKDRFAESGVDASDDRVEAFFQILHGLERVRQG